jgi:hypothetical protein
MDNPAPFEKPERLLQYFKYADHVPETEIGIPFRAMAEYLVKLLPSSAERTLALRKLIDCRDEAFRALQGVK